MSHGFYKLIGFGGRALLTAVAGPSRSVARAARKQLRTCCYLVLTPLLLSSTGCGTLGTMFDPQCGKWEPYSGVAASAGGHMTQMDIPFSFGLDTACLPITIPKHFIERAHQGKKTGSPPAQSPAPTPAPEPLANSEPPR